MTRGLKKGQRACFHHRIRSVYTADTISSLQMPEPHDSLYRGSSAGPVENLRLAGRSQPQKMLINGVVVNNGTVGPESAETHDLQPAVVTSW